MRSIATLGLILCGLSGFSTVASAYDPGTGIDNNRLRGIELEQQRQESMRLRFQEQQQRLRSEDRLRVTPDPPRERPELPRVRPPCPTTVFGNAQIRTSCR